MSAEPLPGRERGAFERVLIEQFGFTDADLAYMNVQSTHDAETMRLLRKSVEPLHAC